MNHSQDDSDPLADAFRLRRATRVPAEGCPDPEDIFEAAAGGLERSRREAIIDHVAICPDCSEAWRLAMAMGASPVQEEVPAPATPIESALRRVRPNWGLPRLAVAAGVASLAVLVLLTLRQTDPQLDADPGYRSAADAVILQSRTPEVLRRERFLLSWSGGPAGSSYTLRVTTADLQPVFTRAGIREEQFHVPAAELADIASGAELLWQVEARAGERTVTSDAHVVTLR